MKKLLTIMLMAVYNQTAFAQMEGLEEVFHTGSETEKAAATMMEEVMASIMRTATASSNKPVDEQEVAQGIFKAMAKHSQPIKAAMQKDCQAEADAKACECFYNQVDLKEMFVQLETAVAQYSNEEDVEKALEPYVREVRAKRAQCQLN